MLPRSSEQTAIAEPILSQPARRKTVSQSHQATKPLRSSWWSKFQIKLAPYGFLSPFIILFLVFSLFPLLFSMYLSFHIWNPVKGLDAMKWVGWENYGVALEDPWVWKSLYNTVWMGLASGTAMHLTAIPVAYLLVVVARKSRNFFSSVLFLPYVTSTVAIAIVFFNMYSANSGIINEFIKTVVNFPGLNFLLGWLNQFLPLRWLDDADLLKPAISFVQYWRFTGFFVVLYISGFLTISKDIREAAKLDGCTERQFFWHIALPLIRPFVFFGVTLTLIGSLNMFEEPFIMTLGNGGTDEAALTMSMYLYRLGWEWLEMGTASALSWLLFLLIGVCTLIYFALFGRKGMGEGT